MERTISGMMGKGSVNHNTRAFTAKNVDKERSRDNVEFCHSDIKEVYRNLFDEALERYNAKQKRSTERLMIITKRYAGANRRNYFMKLSSKSATRTIRMCRAMRGGWRKRFYVSLWSSFRKEIRTYMYYQVTCTWTSRHHISILILFPLSVTVSVGLIQEYR